MVIKRFFYTLKQAFKQVLRNRAMTVASIFAITAMLLILSLFFILVINVNTAAQSIQQDYDSIEIYLADETTEEQANEIIADIEQENGVQEAYYKTKEEAMEEFRTRWGENGYLLDSLQENPLPNSVVVMIDDLEQAENIAEKAATYDGIEDVQFYKDTVDKLLSATRYIQIAAIIVMVFLIIVSIVVVSNTIKHGIQQGQRDKHNEICRRHQLVHKRTVSGGGNNNRHNISRYLDRAFGAGIR